MSLITEQTENKKTPREQRAVKFERIKKERFKTEMFWEDMKDIELKFPDVDNGNLFICNARDTLVLPYVDILLQCSGCGSGYHGLPTCKDQCQICKVEHCKKCVGQSVVGEKVCLDCHCQNSGC